MCLQIYEDINNGVYRSGFATTQAAYDDAQTGLYRALGEVEARLSKTRFLLGDKCTVRSVSRGDALCRLCFSRDNQLRFQSNVERCRL